MIKTLYWVGGIVLVLMIAFFGMRFYFIQFANPEVMAELKAEPNGERAQKVMILTLPDGRDIPVNYLREGDMVYVGCDGRWWRTLVGGASVTVFIKGESVTGQARAVTGDKAYRNDVFARLRPNAPTWFPESLKGILIEITLDGAAAPAG